MAGMVISIEPSKRQCMFLTTCRTAEQSEGKKTVGVDPTVITAREALNTVYDAP